MGYAEVHFYNRIVDSQRVRMFLFYSIKICDFFLTIFFFFFYIFSLGIDLKLSNIYGDTELVRVVLSEAIIKNQNLL